MSQSSKSFIRGLVLFVVAVLRDGTVSKTTKDVSVAPKKGLNCIVRIPLQKAILVVLAVKHRAFDSPKRRLFVCHAISGCR
jgi:hypothetical protein